MISIGQGLEHSTDMEMVDLSTYVPHLSPVTQQYFIRYSGRIMATYSGLTTVERPFILAPYPNLTPELPSLVIYFKMLSFFLHASSWYYFCEAFTLNLVASDSYVHLQ